MNIYIDVGHGKTGEDGGASATSGGYTYYENERNLRIARSAKKFIESYGHTVTLSRNENVNLEKYGNYGTADSNLIRSAQKCKAGTYDAMISIHCNDSSNASARGFLTVWKTGDGTETKSKALCDSINDALLNYISPEGAKLPKNDSRKVLDNGKDHYGILRLHNKPGVLIEVGFMSNARDLHELLCYYNQLGEAIGKGVVKNYGELKKEESVEDCKDEIFELKCKLTDYQIDYDAKCAEIKSKDEEIFELKCRLTDYQIDYDKKCAELKNLQNQINNTEKEFENTKTKCEMLEVSYNKLSKENKELKVEVDRYSLLENDWAAGVELINKENRELRSKIEDQQFAINEFIAEINDLKNTENTLEVTVDDLSHRLQVKTSELEQMVPNDINRDGKVDLRDVWDLLKIVFKK